ncbi:MAG TPA: hypothetical protein VJV23_11120 [Candidatus Polarisedimenticolia bacterium]|nr:hypothetical protein [Candidatus Polarisedimenticolia bacterium]
MDRKVRIGDVLDDYCPRCKLVMNHGVIVLAGDEILKVRCNTCLNEHPYRKGKGPKKKDPVRAAYEELLGKLPRPAAPAPAPRDEPDDEE